jgi:hypothetical protein
MKEEDEAVYAFAVSVPFDATRSGLYAALPTTQCSIWTSVEGGYPAHFRDV